MDPTPLVTYSHLAWDSVFQRPHHLMTRLAAAREILFVEEPRWSDGTPLLEIRPVAEHLRVARPWLPEPGPGFGAAQEATLLELLEERLLRDGWSRHVAWLYTPMAVRLARTLAPVATVYDCMDELSAFLGAPPELVEREAELLGMADAVFAGGPSLYRARKDRHRLVRCFPSSVDRAHFASAAHAEDPDDQAALPSPRLGFFGVIDERMDLGLLDALARARPEWQIVLLGPVVKIDPASLPRLPNVHHLGSRAYADLPAYLSGWDACLIPFAMNEATRFISPTKVLEYMAADRPIVTTPIADVVEPYGDIVYAGGDPASFVAACEQALHETPGRRRERRGAAARVLQRTSWETTARHMNEIVRALADRSMERARSAPVIAAPREATA